MLVIITERYDSSALNQKVFPTPIDAEGRPKYAIYLDDDRAKTLIEHGVATEYVPEELIVGDPTADEVCDPDTNEGSADTDSDVQTTSDNINDDVTGDKEPIADDSSKEESKEPTTETKSKNNSKKSKSSK